MERASRLNRPSGLLTIAAPVSRHCGERLLAALATALVVTRLQVT